MPGEKTFNITIPGPGPWGFRLAGGRDFNTPLYISKVTPGGKAATSNVLLNDCVVSINGMETDKMTHLEAQGAIKNAVGNLAMKIMRGEATLWKPKITRDETDAVTNVSLQADKQKFTHAGAKHNVTAKPFGSPGAGGGLGTATVVHKQFNSPVGLYSAENIADSFKGQTEGMIAGRVGADPLAGQSYGQQGQQGQPYTPTYQEPPTYAHGQASAQYIDKADDEEMKYSGFINPGSQSRSFKMLQSITADDQPDMAPPPGVRSVRAPTLKTTGGSKPAPSVPVCVRCNVNIVGPVLKAKDKTLHPECFTCYTCSNSLKNKGFFTVQGREYCGDCEKQARMDASGPQGSYTNGAPTAHHTPAAAPYAAKPQAHHAPAPAPGPAPYAPSQAHRAPAASHQSPAHQRNVAAPPPPPVDNKQTPSQVASHTRSNPAPPRAMSQPPRPPGPPPAPAYGKAAPRPSAPVARQQAPAARPQAQAARPQAPAARPQAAHSAPHAAHGGGGAAAAGRTPMCDGCDSIIRGPFVSAVGRNWHPEHFVCAHCHENLSTQGFVEQNGKVYCEQDFNNLYSPRCGICNKGISQGGCVQAMGNQYHANCFVCGSCKQPITGSAFHIHEGKPYCKRDYQAMFAVRCASCNYPVEPGDPWVEALNKQWHSNCFICSNPSCEIPLEGQAFYAERGQPYCQRHAP